MYSPHCGFDQCVMSFGHDEYLYRVLANHGACRLPEEALYMIRYHSFYPWHSQGDYAHLASDHDWNMLKQIHLLKLVSVHASRTCCSQYDLYSKIDNMPDIAELKPYYARLIDEWCPGQLRF